jgi:hypothetical protein
MLSLIRVVAFLILGCGQAFAAVVLDNCGAETLSSSGVTTLDYVGITVGSGLTNSGFVTIVSVTNGGPISAVTADWDHTVTAGGPFSQTALGNANNGSAAQIYFFGLRNPIAGLKTARVSWTGPAQVSVIICSWQGLDTTSDATAFKNFNSSSGSTTSSQSVTVTSTANDAVMAAHNGVGTSYASVNQTQIFIDNSGLTFAVVANRATGVVNPTMTANFSGTFTTVSAGVSIAAAGGGGGPACSGGMTARGAGVC